MKLKLNKVEVGTVEIFQGREKDIIIISTVRSKTFFHDNKKHIGFLENPRRLNVAVTRAKSLLIVFGNPMILKLDHNWRHLINVCIDNKTFRGQPQIINRFADDDNLTKEPKIITSRELYRIYVDANKNTRVEVGADIVEGASKTNNTETVEENDNRSKSLFDRLLNRLGKLCN